MRKIALSIMLIGGLTASSAAFAAHGIGGLGGVHGLSSPGLSMSHTNSLPSTFGGLGTHRLFNNNALGGVGSSCNMPTYAADRNMNCQ